MFPSIDYPRLAIVRLTLQFKIHFTETTLIAGNYEQLYVPCFKTIRAQELRREEVRHYATTDNARLPLYCARYQLCSLSFSLFLARFTLSLPRPLSLACCHITDVLLFIYAHLQRRAEPHPQPAVQRRPGWSGSRRNGSEYIKN